MFVGLLLKVGNGEEVRCGLPIIHFDCRRSSLGIQCIGVSDVLCRFVRCIFLIRDTGYQVLRAQAELVSPKGLAFLCRECAVQDEIDVGVGAIERRGICAIDSASIATMVDESGHIALQPRKVDLADSEGLCTGEMPIIVKGIAFFGVDFCLCREVASLHELGSLAMPIHKESQFRRLREIAFIYLVVVDGQCDGVLSV